MSIDVSSQVNKTLDDGIYQAFLLRCWQESPPAESLESTWRFSLIHIDGLQTKKGFACLEDLLEYLQAQLAKCDAVSIEE